MINEKLILNKRDKDCPHNAIITWNRAGKDADIFAYDPDLTKRLRELKKRVPDEVMLNRSADGSVQFIIPKKYITIKLPQKKKSL